jgi:hypothetical protein
MEVALMLEEVVAPAAELQVVEAGCSVVGPVGDVVSVAPVRWGIAAGFDAATVADLEGPAQGGGHEPGATAEIEDLASGVHEDPADGGVAGEGADQGRGDRTLPEDLTATWVTSGERRPARVSASTSTSMCTAGGASPVARRTSASARRCARLRRRGRVGGDGGLQRVERTLERGPADRVEQPFDVHEAVDAGRDVMGM